MQLKELKSLLTKNSSKSTTRTDLQPTANDATNISIDHAIKTIYGPSLATNIDHPLLNRVLLNHDPRLRSKHLSELMISIFLHPEIRCWKRVAELFGCKIQNPEFLTTVNVSRAHAGEKDLAVRIDLSVMDYYAKLTLHDWMGPYWETHIEKIDSFRETFDAERLPSSEGRYHNHPLIMHLIAAFEQKKKFVLVCDRRHTKITEAFTSTIACLKSKSQQSQCRLVFWQDLACACEDIQLVQFLKSVYML